MRVEIHTDGSCEESGRVNSPGGWAAVLRSRVNQPNGVIYYPHERVIQGAKWATTSIEMELTAIQEGLLLLNENAAGYQVHIYTDCQEAIDICTKKYRQWMDHNWHTREGKPIAERVIIEKIVAICRQHDPIWHWVKSHVDNDLNNHVDQIAREARMALKAAHEAAVPNSEYKDIPFSREERDMLISQLKARSEHLQNRTKDLKGRPNSRRKLAEIAETHKIMREVIRKLY